MYCISIFGKKKSYITVRLSDCFEIAFLAMQFSFYSLQSCEIWLTNKILNITDRQVQPRKLPAPNTALLCLHTLHVQADICLQRSEANDYLLLKYNQVSKYWINPTENITLKLIFFFKFTRFNLRFDMWNWGHSGQCFRTCWEENPNRKKIRSRLFSWCVSEVTRLECRLNLAQQRYNLVHLSSLYAGYTLKKGKRNFWNYKLVLVGNFKENSKHTYSGKWFSEMQYIQS